MKTLLDKQKALAAFIQQTLFSIDPAFVPERVETRLREAVLSARYAKDRARIMGQPVRYVSLFHAGIRFPEDDAMTLVSEVPDEVTDTFFVQLWYAYEDATTYDGSSQAVFDRIVDPGREGSFIHALAHVPYLDGVSIDEGAALSVPRDIAMDLPVLGTEGRSRAHHLSFFIDLT